MSLPPGTRLGVYEIAAQIGEGGMGAVYRGTDTTLSRQVAIKVLPEAFAADPGRLARFEREAKTLASLNHPNIAAIFGFEKSGSTHALVMELVEGDDLSQRIARGAIPSDEALPIAKQIAEALEAAHEQGIIHRDLKPANIKVRADGTVKVLDFGLAKALQDPRTSGPQDLVNSPTITTPAMTQAGMILGTAAYMAPEQARGKAVDRRADIWAFGAVLFEMLTGARAFGGEDLTDTLAAVVRAEPNWALLPAGLPSALVVYLKRCLQKDPKQRIPDIAAMRLALDGAFDTTAEAAPSTPPREMRRRKWAFPAAAALLSAAVVGTAVWQLAPRSTPTAEPTRFIFRAADDAPLTYRSVPLALSPNGRDLIYEVFSGATSQLFHLNLTGFEARAIEGGRGSISPFFSPRGDVIGFYSPQTGQLQRVDLAGGSPARLVDTGESIFVASWSDDGTVVFTQEHTRPLSILRPGASKPVDLTRFDATAKEQSHIWPQVLPGRRGVLFTTWNGDPTWDEARLAVADLETGEHRIVLEGGASGRYAASGHLVFWRGGALMAVAFDLDTLAVRGEPVRVVQDVRLHQGSGAAHFAISDGGTLAYVRGKEEMFSQTFLADRAGQRLLGLDESGAAGYPAFSPDGTRVALTIFGSGAFGAGVFDIARRQVTALSLTGDNVATGWTGDGDKVTFMSNRSGEYAWYSARADGSGTPEPLFTKSQGISIVRGSWSRDGRYFVYGRGGMEGTDIWLRDSDRGQEPRSLVATPAVESAPALSPDGRFIAYQSDESGAVEVYVRPFPDVDTRRIVVSRAGGHSPAWSRDGRNIFYASESGMMQVAITPGADGIPQFGQPSLLFRMGGIRNFDVSPDAKTFAIERAPTETLAREIHVVTNWYEELKRLVPPK